MENTSAYFTRFLDIKDIYNLSCCSKNMRKVMTEPKWWNSYTRFSATESLVCKNQNQKLMELNLISKDVFEHLISTAIENGNTSLLDMFKFSDFREGFKLAVNSGHIDSVLYFIRKDVSVNSWNGILGNIVYNDHYHLLPVLLKHGLILHLNVNTYKRALTDTCTKCNFIALQLLLHYGTNININLSPFLEIVAEKGHSDSVRLLLDKMGKSHQYNRVNQSMILACRKGHIEVVSNIMEFMMMFNIQINCVPYMIAAINNNQLEVIEFFLAGWVMIDTNNNLFIRQAAAAGKNDVIDLLYNKEVNYELDSLLNIAVRNNQLETVKHLVERGADIHQVPRETPLNLCMIHGLTDIFGFFIEKGLDFKNFPGFIRVALIHKQYEMVTFLLKKGASFGINHTIETLVDNDQIDLIKTLIKIMGTQGSSAISIKNKLLLYSAEKNYLKAIILAVKLYPNFCLRYILLTAIKFGNVDIIRFVHSQQKEIFKITILHHSIENKSIKSTRFLIHNVFNLEKYKSVFTKVLNLPPCDKSRSLLRLLLDNSTNSKILLNEYAFFRCLKKVSDQETLNICLEYGLNLQQFWSFLIVNGVSNLKDEQVNLLSQDPELVFNIKIVQKDILSVGDLLPLQTLTIKHIYLAIQFADKDVASQSILNRLLEQYDSLSEEELRTCIFKSLEFDKNELFDFFINKYNFDLNRLLIHASAFSLRKLIERGVDITFNNDMVLKYFLRMNDLQRLSMVLDVHPNQQSVIEYIIDTKPNMRIMDYILKYYGTKKRRRRF